MLKRTRLTFAQDSVVASAELLERDAPETCSALWQALPFDGTLYHAIWSGPETYLPIDPQIRIAPENQTTQSQIGDIGYYCVDGGRIASWPDDFSEIAFFYGRGARPSMPTGSRRDESLRTHRRQPRRLRGSLRPGSGSKA